MVLLSGLACMLYCFSEYKYAAHGILEIGWGHHSGLHLSALPDGSCMLGLTVHTVDDGPVTK